MLPVKRRVHAGRLLDDLVRYAQRGGRSTVRGQILRAHRQAVLLERQGVAVGRVLPVVRASMFLVRDNVPDADVLAGVALFNLQPETRVPRLAAYERVRQLGIVLVPPCLRERLEVAAAVIVAVRVVA